MKISEIIEFLEKKKKVLGDIEVFTEIDTGRESWISSFRPQLTQTISWKDKKSRWFLEHDGY